MSKYLESLLHDLGVCFCIIVLLTYFKVLSAHSYWKKLNVPFIPPVPIFGSIFGLVFSLESITSSQMKSYYAFRNHRYVGIYVMTRPHLVIRDPNLIKSVLIKDFTAFRDRGISVDSKISPLLESILHSEGHQWKDLRNKISTVFSANTVKKMNDRIVACGQDVISLLTQRSGVSVDVHDVFTVYVTNVVGACVFGVREEEWKNHKSTFHAMCREITHTSWRSRLRFALRILIPNFYKDLKIHSVPKNIRDYFTNLVQERLAARDRLQDEDDFIGIMLKVQKFKDNDQLDGDQLSDALIIASAFVFFLAGFQTTACTLTYCLYEISKDTDIQSRLYGELRDALADKTLSYDNLAKLPYLDQIVNETMRKYPTVPIIMRKSTKEYKIPDSSLTLTKDSRVDIPVFAIHHDPDIYKNPDQFDPDRFSEANKHLISRGTYLPFGCGPRICTGIHFALLEIKTMIAQIVSSFEVKKSLSTPDVLQFNKSSYHLLVPDKEVLIEFNLRE